MELVHTFSVAATLDETWALLTDVNRVANCLPGATIENGEIEPYTGHVKLRIGAVTVQLRGEITFEDIDPGNHRLTLIGQGADPRGGSGAQARIRMELTRSSDTETQVKINTELQLSGKIAQFGKAMLEDVSQAILGQFVTNLEGELKSDPDAARKAPEQDAIDLGSAVLPVLLRRYGPISLAALSLLIALAALLRSRRCE